jgi:hypothetical protein
MPRVAYRAVRGRRKFNKSKQIIDYMASTMDSEVKPHFIKEFDKRTVNWKHKPEFRARKFIRPDSHGLYIFPAGPNKKIWIWNTKGTRRHKIPLSPKTVGTLAFLWGGKGSYRPKTKPGGKYGGPGTVMGGKMHFPKQVDHPGTKAREHEKFIVKENKPWYTRNRENAWRRAIRRA